MTKMEDPVIRKRIIVKDGQAIAVSSGVCATSRHEEARHGAAIRDLPPAFILDGKLYDERGEEIDVGGEGVGRRFRIIDCTRKVVMEETEASPREEASAIGEPETNDLDACKMVLPQRPLSKLTDDQMQSNWDKLS